MATMARGGRITPSLWKEEKGRLLTAWQDPAPAPDDTGILSELMTADQWAEWDLFDRMQLAAVVRVCRQSATLSEAGRALFGVSREKKTHTNDADRLRKFLARFGLTWRQCQKR